MYMYMIPQNECFSNYVSTFTKGKMGVSTFSKRAQHLPLFSGEFFPNLVQSDQSVVYKICEELS